jgi:hypothetical protein
MIPPAAYFLTRYGDPPLALPIFVITIFVSSGLLFLVQPMVGKMILPRLGGAPQVWNTCMVFFQAALLLGYGYTHTASTRLPFRRQILVHCGLLLLPFLFLLVVVGQPFNFSWFVPPPGGNPIPQTLLVLTIVVGVPFIVVATSAPLLQRWFANTGHPTADDPYYLYAASNFGSLLSLLSYPVLVEPNLGLRAQAWMWTGLYTLLAVLVAGCAYLVWKAPPRVQLAGPNPAPGSPPPPAAPEPRPSPASTAVTAAPRHVRGRHRGIKKGTTVRRPGPEPAAAPAPAPTRAPVRDEVTMWRRLRWIALAAVPTSLMLGVTTYMTIDISAITYFWVIPLALYLLSFILVFLRWPIPWTGMPHLAVSIVQPLILLFLIYTRVGNTYTYAQLGSTRYEIVTLILVNLAAFFVTALVCHGELASDRPSTRYLTEFYLWMAVGGVLGGIFNAIIAPVVFTGVVEYPLALALAGFLRPRIFQSGLIDLGLVSALPQLAEKKPVPEVGPGQPRRRIQAPQPVWPTPNPSLSYTLDVVLGVGVVIVAWLCVLWTDNPNKWVGRDRDLVASYGLIRYVLPLVLCFFLLGRPLRFGLAFAGIILVHAVAFSRSEDNTLCKDRSYFGVLRVYKMDVGEPQGPPPLTAQEQKELGVNSPLCWYTYLMHGTTYHGQNYQQPGPLRRLATTYYHRLGPVGVVMDRFNWFKDPINSYHSDSRLPASLVGMATAGPLAQLVTVWSEPPYATIGLGTGTMASYAHPYQEITFYDIDQHIVNFSEPPGEDGKGKGVKGIDEWLQDAEKGNVDFKVLFKLTGRSLTALQIASVPSAVLSELEPMIGKEYRSRDAFLADLGKNLGKDELPRYRDVILSQANYSVPPPSRTRYFNYYNDATLRGGKTEIIMGDARLSMAEELPARATYFPKRDNYYWAIIVDAFSSDAIPVHLITEEAIQMYMSKIAEHGVLCVHTSNRHVELIKPVADVAVKLGLKYRVGHDLAGSDRRAETGPRRGLFTSEWIMLARHDDDLPPHEKDLPVNSSFEEVERYTRRLAQAGDYHLVWYTPEAPHMRLWTDDYSNLFSVFRWR